MPRGRLSGAEKAVNACKGFFEGEVYGSIRHSEDLLFYARMRLYLRTARAFLFIFFNFELVLKGACYVGLPRFVQKVASR